MKQSWAAPDRNKLPIFDVLARVLPARGALLEIASGSGQHAAFFAERFPSWTWTPSDVSEENLASVSGWAAESGLDNLHAAVRLDVCEDDWKVGDVDAVFCANMIHIAPWECCVALIRGAARHLNPGGMLLLYGPFRISGEHTSDSNRTFDESLRARDARWGVRNLNEVTALANASQLEFVERVAMPANNQLIVYSKASAVLSQP